VITHLPNQDGYHKKRLNVIKACLESMRINAGEYSYQIMVWDNGSCDALLHWLKRSYRPDYLVTSPNVGKSIARASIVRMLPPETVVGVSDDDMFFYPDWLKAHLEVLNVYPNVGTVSGWPVRTQHRFYNFATKRWGERTGTIEYGRFISPQEDKDFCTSVGRDYLWHVSTSYKDVDARINWRSVWTYATGHHAQWVGKAGVIAPCVAYTPEAMPSERPFEEAIDRAELLRLTTYKRYTRHIGNILDPDLEELWRELR
jgi:hypothetical protein